MKPSLIVALCVVASVAAQPQSPGPGQRGRGEGRGQAPRAADPLALDDHAGFDAIFDGSTLKGWDGDPSF